MSGRSLTEQFYRWEQRGRGWHLFERPVDLEPAFEPFLGHFVQGEIIDDGLRPRWWNRLLAEDKAAQAQRPSANPDTQEILAYASPDTDISVTYAVSLPKSYVPSASSMERLLTALSATGETFSFELAATSSLVTVQFVCGPASSYWLETQLNAYFPECLVMKMERDVVGSLIETAGYIFSSDFGLREEFMRPISFFEGKSHDPHTPLFGIVEQLREHEAVVLQVLFCGARHSWAESMTASVTDSLGGSFFYNAPEMPKLAQEKTAFPLVCAAVRAVCMADTRGAALRLLGHASLAIEQASESKTNALSELPSADYQSAMRISDIMGRRSHRLGMILNVRELATLVHPPSVALSNKTLAGNRATKRAPESLNDESYILGVNEHMGKTVPVGISSEQRTRHIHILGSSGVGKSTLLHSLICQDISSGNGLCCIDPHGDLIDAVLDSVPAGRVKDVVLIDPSDSEFPVAFNILSAHGDLERELLASDLVNLFRRFSTSWGDNLHSVLANAIMAFLYNTQSGHLGDLRKFLIEKAYREQFLSTCTDEELRYYWRVEYPLLKTSSIGSILTRLDGFLRPRAVRNMVCQRQGLDFGSIMDGNKIILVKLSQGLIGTENSYLLGACIVAKLQQCAMARQQQAARKRVPFFCYIDEFHHFVTESMGAILSGIRKFNFGLVLAHQNMQQVRNDDISSSLMSAGTRICFGLSDADAKRMQEGFSGFSADDLQNLGVGQAIARVNTSSADFNLSVVPTTTSGDSRSDCITHSRQAYSAAAALEPQAASNLQREISGEQKQSSSLPSDKRADDAELHEHRYLQNFVKALAEQHGYRANLEVRTADNGGQVDVELERSGERIAVEISVTTTAEWELHNIRKCLSGDYAKVVVCSSNQRKLEHIQRKINDSNIPDAEKKRVALISPHEIQSIFAPLGTQERERPTTMKGYRIKVQYEPSKDEGKTQIIQRILKVQKPSI